MITSSIGRKDLIQTIESVRAQTTKCIHYVFVNGARFHDLAREILKNYPDVHAIYIPEDTGDYGGGPSMADVFAAAPFLTNSEWILYLDDDNFFEPNHIETLLSFIKKNSLKWAYSLRKFIDVNGKYICNDNWDNLGHWSEVLGRPEDHQLVDNSCYMVHRSLAKRCALAWTALPHIPDRCFFLALKELKVPCGCSGLYTVNYRIGASNKTPASEYLKADEVFKKQFPDGYPWKTPRVF